MISTAIFRISLANFEPYKHHFWNISGLHRDRMLMTRQPELPLSDSEDLQQICVTVRISAELVLHFCLCFHSVREFSSSSSPTFHTHELYHSISLILSLVFSVVLTFWFRDIWIASIIDCMTCEENPGSKNSEVWATVRPVLPLILVRPSLCEPSHNYHSINQLDWFDYISIQFRVHAPSWSAV